MSLVLPGPYSRPRPRGIVAILTTVVVSTVFCIVRLTAGTGFSQGARTVPRIALPDVAQEGRAAPEKPLFRASVTRVEVSALVLDRDGAPARGLTAADFAISENGVPQIVTSFAPFTHQPELLALPNPVSSRNNPSQPPASMPATNYFASASRVFALILDDLHVDVRRTQVARAAARRLLDHLTPSDLLFVAMTSSSESTGYLTRDRRQAAGMIERFTGQRLPHKTIGRARFPGHDFEAERLDHYQRLCATLRNIATAFRDVSGRRKTVILVSEGSSFGAGLSDMIVRMPTATGGGRAHVPTGASRVMNEALAAAAAGNVAIYPLNPAGLGADEADLIEVFGSPDYASVMEEARQAHEMGRDLAALTGGVSLVDTNDTLAGIDRAVRDASSHYILSYEPQPPSPGRGYRTITVQVRRAGMRVLARRGYVASVPKPMPPMTVPGSLSPQLRTLLSGVIPDDGLPMTVQAVPVGRPGKTMTVAVIVEVNGSGLSGGGANRLLKLEQGLLTVNAVGRAANGERRVLDVSLRPSQWDALLATGLRTVWALELPAGKHHVRVASIDSATGRGGSVYLDVNVPDGGGLPPDPLVASRMLSTMPTAFADQRLAAWTTVMPTATRVFPAGDVLTVTVPHAGPALATAELSNTAGTVVWNGPGTPIGDGSAVQFVVPLGVASTVSDLVVKTSYGTGRTTIAIAPRP